MKRRKLSLKIICWTLLSAIILGSILYVSTSKLLNKHQTDESWEISPYPDGFNFAFTIIHDADDAYSKRLAPLIETFNRLGMKITVSLFVFPGSAHFEKENQQVIDSYDKERREFFGPRNIPLTNDYECKFYKKIAAEGYEIGMHTPSATSDTRERIIQAFEMFNKVFGHYPKVYVEHGRRFNKETQSNEGSDPKSPYYCTDLLNRYRCWAWVDGPGALAGGKNTYYDVLKSDYTPFSHFALKKYGILKGFVRTGQWKDSNGDGFLKWYTREHIDSLDKNRGLALVYTHLDRKWIDPKTKKMRAVIKKRLTYLVSKNGWFVPAGQILDRFEAVKNIHLSYNEKWLKVINGNPFPINGLTLISHSGYALKRNSEILRPNKEKEILIGRISSFETAAFEILSH